MVSTTKPEYDLFSADALANPYPLYRTLREADPVYYFEASGYWVLTRYQDVKAALSDSRLSSDRYPLFARQLGDLDVNLIQNFLELNSNLMIEKDPPEHTQMRQLADRAFTAKAVQSWRSIIQDNTDRLLDCVQGQGSMDIVADLSVPLPALLIAEIFGVEERDRQNLVGWSQDITTFWGAPADRHEIEALARKADRASYNFMALIRSEIEKRRQNPGTDMISVLMAAYVENEIDLARLPSLCILILVSGHTTTTDLIPNGIYALLQHPEQLQKLKANPALMSSTVEEILRFDTSAPFMFRIAKEDLTLGDREIPAGSIVALGLGAANRDPEIFNNPDTFDIERSPNEHLGFGPGIHLCLGSVLARMELQICFKTLLQRMPDLRLDPDKPAVRKWQSMVFKGFETLPVRF